MSTANGSRPPLRADKRYGSKPKPAVAPKKAAKPKARKNARAKAAPKARRGPIMWLVRLVQFVIGLIWGLFWRTGMILTLIVAGAIAYFYADLPPVSDLVDGRTKGSVTLLDRAGDVFAWRGQHFDQITNPGQVSPHIKNAVIATEDKRFYRHFGISPRGVASAVRINLSEGRGPLSGHGGSTLTQQTAKLLCLGEPFDPAVWKDEAAYEADCRRGSMWRKVKEAIYALAMEARYTKDEILTIYLNRAFLGSGARGFEAATQRYFGIPAIQANAAQSAMLAGLLVAPTRYAPTNSLERSQERAATVVKLMHDQGYLSLAERDEAWALPATLSTAAQARAGGYFADWLLDQNPSFFASEDVVMQTTLDQDIQRQTEEALAHIFDTKVKAGSKAEAAIVVMSADGAVRAMVGGRRTKVTGAFNRAVQAKRQTGSSFKPFVYATAMDLGYTPNDTVVDSRYCVSVPGSGEYCPKNYTRDFKGRMSLTQALAESRNVPAVKVSEAVGRELVRRVASDFGIDNDLAVGPALALGVSESTLLEMTGAYAGILNGGRSVQPYGLVSLRLQDDAEPILPQTGGFGERVISEGAARHLVYMMHQVIEAGTGKRADLGDRPVAGKTGTTQSARDAWFIGFTANYVAGVWLGYDDNTPLTGVTGGSLPADIWREAMARIHDGAPVRPLPMDPPPLALAERPARPAPEPQQETARPAQPRNTRDSEADSVLENVLRNLFGQRN